jgi:hypothetical protein
MVDENKLGMRFNAGKARWDLLPIGALSELVNVFTYGAKKYAPNNWRKGLKFSDTMAALDRHWAAWKTGEDRDSESGCHHLAHVAWNAFALLEFYLMGREDLDDRCKEVAPFQTTSNIKEPPASQNNVIFENGQLKVVK